MTDSGKIVAREQWDHPHKEGSSLFRFHFSVANIVQSSVIVFHSASELVWAWPASQSKIESLALLILNAAKILQQQHLLKSL